MDSKLILRSSDSDTANYYYYYFHRRSFRLNLLDGSYIHRLRPNVSTVLRKMFFTPYIRRRILHVVFTSVPNDFGTRLFFFKRKHSERWRLRRIFGVDELTHFFPPTLQILLSRQTVERKVNWRPAGRSSIAEPKRNRHLFVVARNSKIYATKTTTANGLFITYRSNTPVIHIKYDNFAASAIATSVRRTIVSAILTRSDNSFEMFIGKMIDQLRTIYYRKVHMRSRSFHTDMCCRTKPYRRKTALYFAQNPSRVK